MMLTVIASVCFFIFLCQIIKREDEEKMAIITF